MNDYLLVLKKSLNFWDKLTPSEQNILLENTRFVTYQAGKTIHNGDANCLGLVIVKTGCIRSYMLSDKGRDITLYRLHSGELCILSQTEL